MPSCLRASDLAGERGLATGGRKAMAIDKTARYRSVEDLQTAILAYQNGFATSAENAGAWKQFTLLVKRHKATSIGLTTVLIVGSVFGTKAILEGRRAERGEALAKVEAARAKAEARRAEDALADLRASAPSLLALAESEAGFQRFDSGLVKLDAALDLDPALTAGWWRRAWLLLGMARYGKAPADFRTAAQRDPAQHAHDSLLPVLDAIAAAPDDATHFPPEHTETLFRHFTKHRLGGTCCVSNPSRDTLPRFLRGSGQRWIRTIEGVSQRIYSPPRLATSVSTRFR